MLRPERGEQEVESQEGHQQERRPATIAEVSELGSSQCGVFGGKSLPRGYFDGDEVVKR